MGLKDAIIIFFIIPISSVVISMANDIIIVAVISFLSTLLFIMYKQLDSCLLMLKDFKDLLEEILGNKD